MTHLSRLPLVTALSAGCFVAAALRPAAAQNVNFSTVNLALVSSTVGQNFVFATGSVNVRLLSGAVNSLQPGSSPDPSGFYILQDSSNLTPAVFRFTFDKLTSFIVNENETLANYEINEFTLPTGSWTINSVSNATVSGTSSDVIFQGTNSAPPYGDYSIGATSQSFDFRVANSPAVSLYGSAIALNIGTVVPEASTFALAIPALVMVGAVVSRRRKPWIESKDVPTRSH